MRFKLIFGLFATPSRFVHCEALRVWRGGERETSRGFRLQLQIKLGVASLPPMCTNHFVLLGRPTNTSRCVGSFKDLPNLAVWMRLPLMMRLDILMQSKKKG